MKITKFISLQIINIKATGCRTFIADSLFFICFGVCTTVLRNNDFSKFCIGLFDVYGILQFFFIYKHYKSSSLSHGQGFLTHCHLLAVFASLRKGPYFSSYSSIKGKSFSLHSLKEFLSQSFFTPPHLLP